MRLKGGDPFVFVRSGEECESLRTAGVECEVVNGITAGLAAPSALGIPTDATRRLSRCYFVTCHAGDDAATAHNWQALVATGLPLVIYIGVSRCDSIRRDLLDAGMRPTMPIAVIQNATCSDQQAIVTTLTELARDIHASGIGSPAIMVVGETVRYANAGAHKVVMQHSGLLNSTAERLQVHCCCALPGTPVAGEVVMQRHWVQVHCCCALPGTPPSLSSRTQFHRVRNLLCNRKKRINLDSSVTRQRERPKLPEVEPAAGRFSAPPQ